MSKSNSRPPSPKPNRKASEAAQRREFGAWLRWHRRKLGLSQVGMCKLLRDGGVGPVVQPLYCAWERGKIAPQPARRTLMRLLLPAAIAALKTKT